MTNLETIHSEYAPKAVGPYSQAVRAGDFIFLSGQIPLNPETMEIVEGGITEQANQVLVNLKAVLAAAGANFNQVVKATVFLKDMNNFADFNAVYEKFFTEHKPARSTIEVARLPKDSMIEIELVVFAK
jgi:2-iminobutanoate/2-iminopropanoate deaminase